MRRRILWFFALIAITSVTLGVDPTSATSNISQHQPRASKQFKLQYDPNAYCCAGTIESVTYVPGKSISATWTNPGQNVRPSELHAGYSPDARHVIGENDPGFWDGNITEQFGTGVFDVPPSSITFQNGAGDTIGQLRFAKTLYVQIWFTCGRTGPAPGYINYPNSASPYCSTPNSRPNHSTEFYSNLYTVHVASASTKKSPVKAKPVKKPKGKY